MWDAASTKKGVLMHSKLILVQRRAQHMSLDHAHSHSAWAYIGSANLSESAW